MKLTQQNEAVRRRYEQAEPKQLGNLHQRMKFLMEALRNAGAAKVSPDVWQGAHDLETEVQYTLPAEPPYARRACRL